MQLFMTYTLPVISRATIGRTNAAIAPEISDHYML
jgi:hypothetical protein